MKGLVPFIVLFCLAAAPAFAEEQFSTVIPSGPGTHTIGVTAVDNAGNESEEATVVVRVLTDTRIFTLYDRRTYYIMGTVSVAPLSIPSTSTVTIERTHGGPYYAVTVNARRGRFKYLTAPSVFLSTYRISYPGDGGSLAPGLATVHVPAQYKRRP